MTASDDRRRLVELEAEVRARLDAHEEWLRRVVDDQRRDAANIVAIAEALETQRRLVARLGAVGRAPRTIAGRVRRLPARARRKWDRRRVEERIRAELPEVSDAELARRRAVVERYVTPAAPGDAARPDGAGGAREPGGPADDQEDHTGDVADPLVVLATSDEPVVSVLVPVHGAIDELMTCLRSLERHPPLEPFEVIVADDASDPAEFAPVRRVAGLRIVRSDENRGFLLTCNAAAEHARGRLLWLLNSDTEVRSGAADALVATFDDFPDAGAVGSKLVYPDGTLQEAGGIVWRDGTAWNDGRGGDPLASVHDHARRADYVSAASLMIDRALWDELGGFDTAFAPAYYEDTDLCLRVAAAGRSVVYQSGSEVVHHEGRSYGTDVAEGGKRHQVVNQETFLRKWQHVLAERRPNGTEPELERDRDVVARILVIDARTLTPDKDSGSLRMANLLRTMVAHGCRATFLPHNMFVEEPAARDLRVRGIEVVGSRDTPSVDALLAERGDEFDVVVLSRLEVAAEHLSTVRRRCPRALVVYDTVDLHFLRQAREGATTGRVSGDVVADETMAAELATVERSDATLVCSTVERDLLHELLPGSRVDVLGNVHEPRRIEGPPERRHGLLFVGGFEHPPNVDAVRWFVGEVLPWLVVTRPDVTLNVVGSRMVPEVESLAGPNVVVHGWVRDLDDLYGRCRVCVAPLRYGAGVKGKVTQSLAHGLPVVGTGAAIEGAGLEAGRHVLVGDTPARFAAAVDALLRDDDLWRRLSDAGLEVVAERFGPDAAAAALDALLTAPRPSAVPT